MITCHKGVLTLLLVFLASWRVGAVTPCPISDTLRRDTVCTFTEKVLFLKASAVVSNDFDENRIRVDSIRSFFSNAGVRNLLSVKITGSHSPEGKYDFNTKLARARAQALADVVKRFDSSVNPVMSVVHPTAEAGNVDFRQLRFAELQVVYRNCPDNTIETDTLSSAANELRVDGDSIVVSESLHADDTAEPHADSCGSPAAEPTDDTPSLRVRHTFGSRLFLSTNLLYDAALTPNIGAGISVTDRVTVLADWMYARWNNREKRRYWRIYGGDAEIRYHIGNLRECSPLGGHHVGVYGSIACYDFQAGRSHKGVLSDKWNYAAGISYTYSLPVAVRLNIDFSLGVGYMWGIYKKHRPIDDCDVWLSTHRQRWFGPTRAGVSLVWLIGNSVANDRKGGGR